MRNSKLTIGVCAAIVAGTAYILGADTISIVMTSIVSTGIGYYLFDKFTIDQDLKDVN